MNYPFYDYFDDEIFYPDIDHLNPEIGDIRLIYNEESKNMESFEFNESGEWVKV